MKICKKLGKPRYNHDHDHDHYCGRCIFLGQFKIYDLYVCVGQDKINNTIIARFGNYDDVSFSRSNGGSSYSGMVFRHINFALNEAFERAANKGLINRDDY